MISTLDSAALLLAGTAAGLIGSAGGITSLVSCPALLAVGLPALSANIANNVALVGCWPGSALASGPELHGQAPWLWRWTLVAAVGGAAGSGLLLLTPSGVFARVVPFLVAAGWWHCCSNLASEHGARSAAPRTTSSPYQPDWWLCLSTTGTSAPALE